MLRCPYTFARIVYETFCEICEDCVNQYICHCTCWLVSGWMHEMIHIFRIVCETHIAHSPGFTLGRDKGIRFLCTSDTAVISALLSGGVGETCSLVTVGKMNCNVEHFSCSHTWVYSIVRFYKTKRLFMTQSLHVIAAYPYCGLISLLISSTYCITWEISASQSTEYN